MINMLILNKKSYETNSGVSRILDSQTLQPAQFLSREGTELEASPGMFSNFLSCLFTWGEMQYCISPQVTRIHFLLACLWNRPEQIDPPPINAGLLKGSSYSSVFQCESQGEAASVKANPTWPVFRKVFGAATVFN